MKWPGFITAILVVVFAGAHAQAQTLADPLPVDTAVHRDTLENGLVYYIRRNAEPAHRAELRLAVNAGSVLEDDDQRGIAHFVEHMLFNGTRRFEEGELIHFFERAGMQFGPDVNAYTSFDETVYTLEVPTDSVEILHKSFEVLQDWAAYATLSQEAIDAERGIIIEEWRRGLGAGGRLRDKLLPELLRGSRYENRLPIGDTLTVRNAPAETLRRFYRDWYRPDLMAIVAVGDFDVTTIDSLIVAHFADLPAADAARARPVFDVAHPPETRFTVATDPEYPYTQLEVYLRRPVQVAQSVGDYRNRLVEQLFLNMLNKRLAEVARDGDSAPFLWARISRGSLARTSAHTLLVAQVEEDSIQSGLAAMLTEITRAARHGFTATELHRQKLQTHRAYEKYILEKDNRPSSALAGAYVASFLTKAPIIGIEHAFALVTKLLPDITLEDINERVRALLAHESRNVVVTLPEKEGLSPPSHDLLASTLEQVATRPVAPYVDAVTDSPLMATIPDPVDITHEQFLPRVGATAITLANGIRVLMKPTDFRNDEVLFSASSPGGASLVHDEEYFAATIATIVLSKSGVGAFDRTALMKKLAGKVVSVYPYINDLNEGLSGRASPSDLVELFQLIHLYITAPRAEAAALASFKNQQRSMLLNRETMPGSAFQDSLIAAFYGDWPRRQTPTVAQIDSLDVQQLLALYQDRFADTDDFTFVFVGNFDVDTLRTLAATYLGTLPVTDRQESWRNIEPEAPGGAVTKVARKGQEPQSQVGIIFHGPFAYDPVNRHRLRSLQAALDIHLRETLREQRAGVYSVAIQSSAMDRPVPIYTLSVYFGCDPDRAHEMTRAVFDEIAAIQTTLDLDDIVVKIREQQRRQRETNLEQNNFWLSTLRFYLEHPAEDMEDIFRYTERIDSLTAEDLRDAARKYLREQYVQVTLLPEQE